MLKEKLWEETEKSDSKYANNFELLMDDEEVFNSFIKPEKGLSQFIALWRILFKYLKIKHGVKDLRGVEKFISDYIVSKIQAVSGKDIKDRVEEDSVESMKIEVTKQDDKVKEDKLILEINIKGDLNHYVDHTTYNRRS